MSTTYAVPSTPQIPHGDGPPGRSAFTSILFADPRSRSESPSEPDYFGDLHLDQIVAAALAVRDEYRLAEFYYQPLHTEAEVRYRHEILADLARGPVRDAVTAFAERMRAMRGHLNLARELRHPLQRRRWFLEAANVYCDATRELAAALEDAAPTSRGLAELTTHVNSLVASDTFGALAADAHEIREQISRLHYTINIKGAHVHVERYEDQADLSAEVMRTFERFQQGAVNDSRGSQVRVLPRALRVLPVNCALLRGQLSLVRCLGGRATVPGNGRGEAKASGVLVKPRVAERPPRRCATIRE